MTLLTDHREKDFYRFAEHLLDRDRLILFPHTAPDPDAIGSALALAGLLREQGKQTRVAVSHPLVPRNAGLPETDRIEVLESLDSLDGWTPVAVDASNLDRLPDSFQQAVEERGELPLFNVDHHVSNDRFGEYNLVDESAAATAEIVYNLARVWELEISVETAEQLYGAIITDTGKFTYANTTGKSLKIGAELVSKGLEIEKITDYLYNYRTLRQLRLMGHIFNSCRTFPELDLMVCRSSTEMLEETGCDYEDNNGATSLLKTVGEYRLVVLLKQKDETEVKVSMRSKDSRVDASRVMESLGGGGHPGAAGCTYEGSLDGAEAALVEALEDYLETAGVTAGEEQGVGE